ncbi:MAG: DUF1007 family protein [Roseicyclus sp.]|jgi:ABC-type uncharacterized transport system substrate-binding protein
MHRILSKIFETPERISAGTGRDRDCLRGLAVHIAVMNHVTLRLVLALGLCATQPAQAHPHIFIDAGLELIRDGDGRVTEIMVTWRYDELYSLILLEDYGLDPDFDLSLTETEVAQTLGFDLNWNSGFEGGLVLRQSGEALTLGPPEPVRLTLLDTGQIETTHRRPVIGSVALHPIEAQVYDPEFYIAFEMILPIAMAGEPRCEVELIRADLDAAYAILESALAEIGGSVAAEDNFPSVGEYFADSAVLTCPG